MLLVADPNSMQGVIQKVAACYSLQGDIQNLAV